MTLFERLRSAVRETPAAPLLTGDFPDAPSAAAVPAAVLIAVSDRADPGVLLTVRHSALRAHAGQIAFPGGRIDAGEDATAAAIREAWEELQLAPDLVRPVAALDPYRTVTNYQVAPILAAVPANLDLVPHPPEVDDWFEAPLAFVLDPTNHQRKSAVFAGAERAYYEIRWEGRTIWGATAAMLVNLSRRLDWR